MNAPNFQSWPKAETTGVLVTLSPSEPDYIHSHQRDTQRAISEALAEILGFEFAGQYDPFCDYPGRVYFVPSETLVGVEQAHELGIYSEDDLYGGVVPQPFVATKSISHRLVATDAEAPEGWSHRFCERVVESVLPGFTAFNHADAMQAGETLLERGAVRVKPGWSSGWRGHLLAADRDQLQNALQTLPSEELACYGVVLEPNLTAVTSCSVGQVRVGGLVASYYGTQAATTDNYGGVAYGGSDLLVVRGPYESLLELDLSPEVRMAIAQTRTYDAATEEFAGLLASRRNYDVAQGLDAENQWHSGVLEQSWRMGGASGPEIAALAAFRSSPEVDVVHAWCVESFGPNTNAPPSATVHFRGIDDRVGPIIKYTLVEPYDTPR